LPTQLPDWLEENNSLLLGDCSLLSICFSWAVAFPCL
jgi:hypothetical protein